jgi:hypothetical protein
MTSLTDLARACCDTFFKLFLIWQNLERHFFKIFRVLDNGNGNGNGHVHGQIDEVDEVDGPSLKPFSADSDIEVPVQQHHPGYLRTAGRQGETWRRSEIS